MFRTIANLLIIAVILAAGWWAYNNLTIGKIEICVGQQAKELNMGCSTDVDCATSLLTAYSGTYPNTELFAKIMLDVTKCNGGKCQLQSFDFRKNKPAFVCTSNETLRSYPATVKDLVNNK